MPHKVTGPYQEAGELTARTCPCFQNKAAAAARGNTPPTTLVLGNAASWHSCISAKQSSELRTAAAAASPGRDPERDRTGLDTKGRGRAAERPPESSAWAGSDPGAPNGRRWSGWTWPGAWEEWRGPTDAGKGTAGEQRGRGTRAWAGAGQPHRQARGPGTTAANTERRSRLCPAPGSARPGGERTARRDGAARWGSAGPAPPQAAGPTPAGSPRPPPLPPRPPRTEENGGAAALPRGVPSPPLPPPPPPPARPIRGAKPAPLTGHGGVVAPPSLGQDGSRSEPNLRQRLSKVGRDLRTRGVAGATTGERRLQVPACPAPGAAHMHCVPGGAGWGWVSRAWPHEALLLMGPCWWIVGGGSVGRD